MKLLSVLLFDMWPWGLIWTAVLLIVFIALSKMLLGWITIPSGHFGLVEKKWSNKGKVPPGRIIATKGEAGIQAELLPADIHFWYWPWMYSVKVIAATVIEDNMIGVVEATNGDSLDSGMRLGKYVDCNDFQNAVQFIDNGGQRGTQRHILKPGTYGINTALFKVETKEVTEIPKKRVGIVTTYDGTAIAHGEIAGKIIGTVHKGFQDAEAFVSSGGERGLQEEILGPGSWYVNPSFAKVDVIDQTEIPIGSVGVVIKYTGEVGLDISGEEFKHGTIVEDGKKGVQKTPLNPGMYPINTFTAKVVVVPTTNIVLNWANDKTEAHKLDERLSSITARAKDGFAMKMDVSQILNIVYDQAAKVIARFGTIENLISQVLEPTIGNYFRNAVQEASALDFIQNRKEQQEKAKGFISEVLAGYNVGGVDTLIGDIVPPDELMAPIRDKKVAEEREKTYVQQIDTENKRSELEKATALANKQAEVVASERSIQIAENAASAKVKEADGEGKRKERIAEADATVLKLTGNAEAEKILAIGKSEAEVTKLKTEAMGKEEYTRVLVAHEFANGKQALVPVVQAGGSGGGNDIFGALVGLEMYKNLKAENTEHKVEAPAASKE